MSNHVIDRDAVLSAWQSKLQGKPSVVARKRKVHRSQPYRWRDPKTAKQSVEYAAVKLVRQLSSDPTTDAEPFLTSLRVAAMTAYREWDVMDLVKEWHRLHDHEPTQDGDEERASRGGCWETFIAEHMEEATLHTRLAAITEILVYDKKVDPRQYTKDGHRIVR